MKPVVDSKALFAVILTNRARRDILLLSGLLITRLFSSLASAQLCDSGFVAIASIYKGGSSPCTNHDQNGRNVDPLAFSLDHIDGSVPDVHCDCAGPKAGCLNVGRLACDADGIPSEQKSPPTPGDDPGEPSKIQPAIQNVQKPKPPDFNRGIYYRNKREFSQDVGWLPINIPFPFDFMMGDDYNTYPLKYTLMPIISSLRWHLDSVKGPPVLRGNWELDISGAVVAIPRGPETRYFAYIMGMRRNFVPRNWRATPYFDWRIGLGDIDAKGPLGVPYAQGQDFTFTLNMGSGVRYNFNSRYAITAGLNWMHISNANLSEGPKGHWGTRNYGINVYGPMFGFVMRLGKPRNPDVSR